MAWIKSLKQGDCDYFCCLYSITNALSKLASSKLGYRSQIYVFNRLLEKLVSIGGLQNIEKKGVPYSKAVKLLKTTQKILFDKYKLKLEISEPFYGQEPDIEKLKAFLKAKNTAVILSISENGGMKHWSVLDKISAKEVSFYDSWVYDKVKLRNIPQPSKLDDIFIMRVQTEYTPITHKKNCANNIKKHIYCTPAQWGYKYQFHTKEQKNMIFNYKRVSTTDQNTERQLLDIVCDRAYIEKISGKNTDRPELQAMLLNIRAGDVINVHSMDRLARNTKDLLNLVEEITHKGAKIIFHKENLTFAPDKQDPYQKMMMTMLGAGALCKVRKFNQYGCKIRQI